jgi:predicted nucleotidyltransferase
MTKKLQHASQLRKEISKLANQVPTLVEPLLKPRRFFKGSVYLSQRRCGKPSCRCARGELHTAWIASTTVNKRRTTRSISIGKLKQLQRMAREYREFRQARIKLRRAIGDLLEAVRAMEEVLAVDVFDSEKDEKP